MFKLSERFFLSHELENCDPFSQKDYSSQLSTVNNENRYERTTHYEFN